MKTKFKAFIIRNDFDSKLEAIFLPSLQTKIDFSSAPDELFLFQQMGQQNYLEYKIRTVIEDRKKRRESIEDASTMALMTQGLSSLGNPGESYDIYFVKRLKDINTNNIDGVAIIIVGENDTRMAYIVINNEFHKIRKEKWCHHLVLDLETQHAFNKIKFNSLLPVELTLENCQLLNAIKKEVCKAVNWIYIGPNSYPLDIFIYDNVRRPCQFFGTVLPPFTRLCNVVNMGIGTLLSLGFLDTMENPFFPNREESIFNTTTGNSTTIIVRDPNARVFNFTQLGCDLAMGLLFVFLGPRQRSIKGLGLKIDDFFINLYNKISDKCSHSSSEIINRKSKKKPITCLDVKIKLLKSFFMLLVFNQLFTMIMMSYLRINALADIISENPDPLFPRKVVENLSLAQWILSQMGDPLMVLGEAAMISFIVEYYLRPYNTLVALNEMNDPEPTLPTMSAITSPASPPIVSESFKQPLLKIEDGSSRPSELKEEKELKNVLVDIDDPSFFDQASPTLFSPKNKFERSLQEPPQLEADIENNSYCIIS